MGEESLFALVLDQPSADRSRFLEEACGADAALLQRLRVLLTAHEKTIGILDRAHLRGSPEPAVVCGPGDEPVGTLLADRYQLREEIGEGGFGTVYLAEQTQPVRRRVALKLIKPGMASKMVRSRFEAERQALALMDHPNIAKVLDAGTTGEGARGEGRGAKEPVPGDEDAGDLACLAPRPSSLAPLSGRPFFVMEYVQGVPFTDYCDDARLSITERLALFIPVCQAVQHAHQKGIIHRDLKPSNVLVALYDGVPVPKVIDFGIAKATAQKLTEHTRFTELGQIVGTLEYMAPEQTELNNPDIDTRADIYSLGVLLYELLTGSLPFPTKQLRSAAFPEMLRMIREVEPPKPSTKLSSSSEERPNIAAHRKLEPRRLMRLVRGDLDWIVMKCLEKERGRRYETAAALALDLQHYLAKEPVLAGPPGTSYRLRKFVRRNHGPVLAATAVLLGLVGGLAGIAWGLVEARRQRDTAISARAEALREAAIAQAVNDFLQTDLLGQADIGNQPLVRGAGRNPNITVGELLDRAAGAIGAKFADQPVTEAAIRLTVGRTYYALGRFAESEPHLRRSVLLRATELGAHHPSTLASKNALALLHKAQGKYDEAEPLFQEVAVAFAAQRGADQPDTLTSKHNLAALYRAQGKHGLAEPLLQEVLADSIARLGADHPETLTSKNNLAALYGDLGKYARAEALYQEVLDRRTTQLGADHPDTLSSKNNLAALYQAQGKYERAEALYQEVLDDRTAKLGADHPDTLTSKNNLAGLYHAQGKFERAEELLTQALNGRIAQLGADHPDTLTSKNNLAELRRAQRKYDQAEPLFREVLAAFTVKLGADHPNTLASKNNLAALYQEQGKYNLAEPLFQEVLTAVTAQLGTDHPDTLASKNNLAELYRAQGKYDRAEPLFQEVLAAATARLGADHSKTLTTKHNLALLYQAQGKYDRAEPLLRELVGWTKQQGGAASPRYAGRLALLGLNLLHQRKGAEAEAALHPCLVIRQEKEPDAWTTFHTQSLLGEALLLQQRHADAEPFLVQGYEGMKDREAKIPPAAKHRLIEALDRLVQLYDATDQKEKAQRWRKQREESQAAAKP